MSVCWSVFLICQTSVWVFGAISSLSVMSLCAGGCGRGYPDLSHGSGCSGDGGNRISCADHHSRARPQPDRYHSPTSPLPVPHTYLYLTPTCTTHLPVPHPYLYLTLTCTCPLPIPHTYLYLTPICTTHLPVPHPYLYHTLTCTSPLPVPLPYLSAGSCSSAQVKVVPQLQPQSSLSCQLHFSSDAIKFPAHDVFSTETAFDPSTGELPRPAQVSCPAQHR